MARPSDRPDRGTFITIEGPEGAGKTTQAARLEGYLRTIGIDVLRTREPGGTPLGERLRDVLLATGRTAIAIEPLADALLFSAARRQLVVDVIGPALDSGSSVICTRYADSTIAYQGYGAGIALEQLRRLEELATGGLRPDLSILLDVAPEVGLRRKAPDDRTRFELGFDLDFHRRVRDGFLEIAASEPGRFVVLDAAASVHRVWEALRLAVADRMGIDAPAGEPNRPVERIIR